MTQRATAPSRRESWKPKLFRAAEEDRCCWEAGEDSADQLNIAPAHTDDITSSFSPILTPSALNSFSLLAGDFPSLLPFALLTSRRLFHETASRDPSSTDENQARALVCETAARWVVEQMDEEDGWKVLSMRFDMENDDGDVEMPLSGRSFHYELVSVSPFCRID